MQKNLDNFYIKTYIRFENFSTGGVAQLVRAVDS